MVDKNNKLLIRGVTQKTHNEFAGFDKIYGLEQGDALRKLLDMAFKTNKRVK